MNDQKIGNIRDFEKYMGIKFQHKVDIEYFLDLIDAQVDIDETDVISASKFAKILTELNVTLEEFIEYYNSEDCEIKDVIKYNPTTKGITVE
jgi:hypothetical protein